MRMHDDQFDLLYSHIFILLLIVVPLQVCSGNRTEMGVEFPCPAQESQPQKGGRVDWTGRHGREDDELISLFRMRIDDQALFIAPATYHTI